MACATTGHGPARLASGTAGRLGPLAVHGPCRREIQSRRVSRRVWSAAAEPSLEVASEELGRTPPGQVVVSIEKVSFTSRRIFACTSIRAPPSTVWDALTDYDGLGDFIPSLVENRCLERDQQGAVLYQVGAQDVAMGMQFKAACKLRIREHPRGMPPSLCVDAGAAAAQGPACEIGGADKLFPWPSQSLPGQPVHGDITFDLVEGDFNTFRGVWRIQQGVMGAGSCWLIYALYVKPQPWLPVGLIQDRISREVVSNLQAVQRHAEARHQQRAAAPA